MASRASKIICLFASFFILCGFKLSDEGTQVNPNPHEINCVGDVIACSGGGAKSTITSDASSIYRKKITKVIIVDAGGNGDYTTVAGAIAVAASGMVIKVMPGTYAEDSLNPASGVDLIGSGQGVTVIGQSTANRILRPQGNNFIAHLTVTNTENTAGSCIFSTGKSNIYVYDVELIGGYDSIIHINSTNIVYDSVYWNDFEYDGGNITTSTDFVVKNCLVRASPTNTYESSFLNIPSGTARIENCDIKLTRDANEGDLSFLRGGGGASAPTITSQNNRVSINAGTQDARGLSGIGILNYAIFNSYGDMINLTGATTPSMYSTNAATFSILGGNLTTSGGGTNTITYLQQSNVNTGSVAIGANTLDTNEWANLDGVNQTLATTSTPRFARIGLGQAADSGAVMAAVGQYHSVEKVDTVVANAWTTNWNDGNVHKVVLGNGVHTVTLSNPKNGGRYELDLVQPSSGAAGTVTWPPSVRWPSDTAPTLTTTNAKIDVIALSYNSANDMYKAAASLNYSTPPAP